MSLDTCSAPAAHARQIAFFFGLIADTLDWNHTDWLALSARLEACGPAHALTLGSVQAAIDAVQATAQEARHD